MKKFILSMLLLCMAAVGTKAQFDAGTAYFGASLSNLGISYSTNERCRWGGGISAGYFVADKFMMKAELGYNHTRTVDDFNASLTGRYYFRENGIFMGAGGEYVHYTPNRNDVMVPVEIGYAFYINHYVTIEPAVYYKMSLDRFSDKSTVGFKLGFGIYL